MKNYDLEKMEMVIGEIFGIFDQQELTIGEALGVVTAVFCQFQSDFIRKVSKNDLKKRHELMTKLLDKIKQDFQENLFGNTGGNC